MNAYQKSQSALELLELEMEILSEEQKKMLLGGEIGQVIGGTGTYTDPVIIYAPIFYGNDLSSSSISGLQTSVNQINSSGTVYTNGKYYKYNLAAVGYATSGEAMNMAGSLNSSAGGDYAGFFKEGSLGSSGTTGDLVLGTAGAVTMTIDPLHISLSSVSTSYVIGHELGHLFGLDHSSSMTTAMSSTANGNPFPNLTHEDLINIIKARGW